jgi:hypothetical protein
MAEVGAEFDRKTGHTLTQLLRRTDMPPEANRKIDSGAAFDVAFVLPTMMDLLIAQGRLFPVRELIFCALESAWPCAPARRREGSSAGLTPSDEYGARNCS